MKVDLLQGTLDMLVLKALSWGPKHGYAIVDWLEKQTNAALLVEEGSLYPALHRMAKRGWVSAQWGVSENNRRAKYYKLAPEGRRSLRAERDAWRAYVAAVGLVLEGA